MAGRADIIGGGIRCQAADSGPASVRAVGAGRVIHRDRQAGRGRQRDREHHTCQTAVSFRQSGVGDRHRRRPRIEQVVPGSAIQRIGAARGNQGIVARLTKQRVVAVAAVVQIAEVIKDRVVVIAAQQEVAAESPFDGVVARLPIDEVVTVAPLQRIGSDAAEHAVTPQATLNCVIAVLAVERIVPVTAINRVVLGPAQDGVITVVTANRVVA